ncbi:MAG: ABC transporter ATP-binding protein [Acidimicrobiales bacterium]|nr:ABC transporter ATP-binding protein [Acidimicrobiales bacterium]
MSTGRAPVLDVRDLTIVVGSGRGARTVVDDVMLQTARGETLGIVGESGSGKTLTMLGALGLLPDGVHRQRGDVTLGGIDVTGAKARTMRALRGRDVGMIFQDPLTSLHPSLRICSQLVEGLRVHDRALTRRGARSRAAELLERVQVPNARERMDDYPHQWSGGMRQRAMIAMAIMHEPSLIVADEPTTALDVTVQAQMLELLAEARDESGASLVLISHDIGVIAQIADRVAVMYAGRVVERGAVGEIFARPRHPYTAGLLASVPTLRDVPGELSVIGGQPPDRTAVTGCAFEPRCPIGNGELACQTVRPVMLGGIHEVACHVAQVSELA